MFTSAVSVVDPDVREISGIIASLSQPGVSSASILTAAGKVYVTVGELQPALVTFAHD